jgi:hypothetical protein
VVAFHPSALEWTGLEVDSPARGWQEHSTYCVVAMVRISHSWQYNLSTLSIEGRGNVSKSVAIVAMFWLD